MQPRWQVKRTLSICTLDSSGFIPPCDFSGSSRRGCSLRPPVKVGKLHLTDKNLDTGAETAPGEYDLADKTYAKLLDKLAEKQFTPITPALQANILGYYNCADRSAIPPKTLAQLEQIKQLVLNRTATASQDPASLDQSDQ